MPRVTGGQAVVRQLEREGADDRPHPVQDLYPPIMVGGGGEQFTLRIAAQHADVWNYWGDLDMLRGKMDVLHEHCETYGTAFEEIQKSWFARCVVRETEAEVDALLEDIPRFKPANFDDDECHLVGTPKQVTADIERYQAAGFEEIVVELSTSPTRRGRNCSPTRSHPSSPETAGTLNACYRGANT